MTYRQVLKQMVMTSDGYDQAEFTLPENACIVRIIRKSTGSHTCYLFSPRGVQIDTLGGADKYDVEVFIKEARQCNWREKDDRNWYHDMEDADLSFLDLD